ncbi:hypothetical protein SS50377_25366 [Spironucleus salmonicida]|uniref:Uncharacterized protein n=1 Tax=Spironucleus salmonicida TaxID=348837 RepID=V6LBG9_9EUKA|nr:hypothetical protein SS50377_25366 [Spironucleus salmonicida]|eukprot:EST41757.1 Hypothetical protein SS50377_18590 [Spironucleus salmonicida]
MELDTPVLPIVTLTDNYSEHYYSTINKPTKKLLQHSQPVKQSSRIPFSLPNITSPARYQHIKFPHKAAPIFESLLPEARFSIFQSADYSKKYGLLIKSGADFFNSRYCSLPATQHIARKSYLDDLRPENGDYSCEVRSQFKNQKSIQASRINKIDRWKYTK